MRADPFSQRGRGRARTQVGALVHAQCLLTHQDRTGGGRLTPQHTNGGDVPPRPGGACLPAQARC